MNIAIIGIEKNRKTGLESWKNQLIKELRNEHNVIDINTKNLLEVIRNIRSIIKSDICHSYSQPPGALIILTIRKLFNKKNIQTVHGDYYEEQKNKKGLKKYLWIPFNRYLNYISDKVTFPTYYLLERITLKEPKIKHKSIVINNFIYCDNINKTKKNKNKIKKIISVTNFNLYQKCEKIKDLISEFKNLDQNRYQLDIVGGGTYFDEFKKNYSSKNIFFLGFRTDVKKLLIKSDYFAYYSSLDNFPMALLEAICLDKPIFAKGLPIFKEILGTDNENKNLKIDLFKKYPNLKIKYSAKEILPKLLQIYDEVLSEK